MEVPLMGIEWFRDLVICILGIVAVVALIIITVMALRLYRRIRPITDSVKATSQRIEGISAQVENEVIKPIIEVATMIQGIRQGINAVSGIFKKK